MPSTLEPGVFLGTKFKARKIRGCMLSEYIYGPRRDSPRHGHEQAYLSFVLAGSWQEVVGSKTRERRPCSLTIHPAGEFHSQELISADARAFQVEFAADWLQRLDLGTASLGDGKLLEDGPLLWQMQRLHAEFAAFDAYSPLTVEGIVLEVLGELGRTAAAAPTSRPPRWFVRVRDILHARFAERLSLEDLSQEVNIHPVHLARTFRRRCRCTIGDYVRHLRVQEACRQLRETDRPVAEIALAAGFTDQSHLSRLVRRVTGLTPAGLRQRRPDR